MKSNVPAYSMSMLVICLSLSLNANSEQAQTVPPKSGSVYASAEVRALQASADTPIVVICHHGMRSMQCARYLVAQGIDSLINLTGGIDAWSTQIDPAVPVY